MSLSIPLYSLPNNAVRVVIGVLYKSDFDSLICFSTCSSKSKLLVKSMKLRVVCIKLDLRNGLSVDLSIYAKYSVMNPTRFTDLEKLTPCQLSTEGRLNFISMPSVRDFLDHFMCIFNRDSIDITFGSRETCIYTLASISMTFEKLRIGYLNIADVYEEEFMFEIITRFSLMKNFFLGRDTARLEPDVSVAGFERLKKVFIGNLTKINLRPNIPLDLSTLLIMNGIDISAARPRISNKDLNTFLKLWMGGSNSRLEMLSLYYPRPEGEQSILDENLILKLVEHKKQESSLRRQFQPEPERNTAIRLLKGGYDILNRNGIFATIIITCQSFTMYVWSSTNTFNVDDTYTDSLFELYERFL
ncbi:unnamed protein product [Caenorhabditis brenneri]